MVLLDSKEMYHKDDKWYCSVLNVLSNLFVLRV